MRASRLLVGLVLFAAAAAMPAADRPRLIVLADMGHDPDDEQQIMHLMVYANEVDIEGLIAVTGRYFRPNPTERVKDLRPYLFHHFIDGYALVYPNLQLHATGWPAPDHLHRLVASGQTDNGIADTGPGKSTAGSRLILAAATKPDPRPLHIVINGGGNTLAQALHDYRATHSPARFTRLSRAPVPAGRFPLSSPHLRVLSFRSRIPTHHGQNRRQQGR